MNWYSLNKTSITVRRDGLLGLGDAGWKNFPEEKQIKKCLSILSIFDNKKNYQIIDKDFLHLQSKSFIDLPFTKYSEKWVDIKFELINKIGLDLSKEIDQLLSGNLNPVIIDGNNNILDGKNIVLLCQNLNIPIRLFQIKK